MHPFDLKTVLLAKHAQHVVLIHFPIALFLVGVLFDVFDEWRKERELSAAAYYNLFAAALATIPVLISGIVAWQWALEAKRLKGLLLQHLVLGCISSVLIWTVWLIHWKTRRNPAVALPRYRLAVEFVAAAAVMLPAHLGGFLSGVNGAG